MDYVTKIFSGRYIAVFLILVITIIIGVFFIFFKKSTSLPQKDIDFIEEKFSSPTTTDTEPQKSTFQPPEIIKAVYLTSWLAANPKVVDYVVNIAKNTEINAVVVDVKDWSGFIAYNTDIPEAAKYGAERILIPDIEAFLERFHREGIYVIARITVFQDPVLAQARPNLAVHRKSNKSLLWLDNVGLAWIDPAAKAAWDYNIASAKDAVGQGFDEINFDYVRFPSDGDLKDMSFSFWDEKTSKHLVIREFFKYLRKELPDAKLSIDFFGLTTVTSNDLGVGQVIEDAFEYFDYVCPMVYPSHYADGFLGYQNPADYPYEVIKYSMESALRRLLIYNQLQRTPASTDEEITKQKRNVQLRPWLQDFDLGAIYDAKMVRSEIEAVYDATGDNFRGFMLWNSSNVYTKEALQPAGLE